MRKLTNEDFIKRVHSIHGTEYTPLEPYKGARTKIKVRHEKCGLIYETTPDNLYRAGCIECGYIAMKSKQRKTHEYFNSEIQEKGEGNYVLLGRYKNNTTKVKIKHLKCGYEYTVTPRDFLSGRRCPNCKNKRIAKSNTKSHDHFIGRLGDSLGDDYELLSKYVNGRTKIKLRHNKCGLVFESLPGHILEGKRCPECWKEENGLRFSKTHEQFIYEMGEEWLEEYEPLSEYEKQTVKMKILHKPCGTEFDVVPDSLIRGSGCPSCRASRGEKEIASWLKRRKIRFIPQFKFDDCVYVDRLRFDFAIMKGDTVIMLIEYQGIQHYEPVDFFGGEEYLKYCQERDKIKREYALKNKIPLLEISYLEDVKEVLAKSIPR